MKEKLPHMAMTGAVIESFYRVYNTLGYGFLEKVYEKAMAVDLANYSIPVRMQVPITVWYAGELIGEYYPDLIVQDAVIVEIKAIKKIAPTHEAQLVNYLKATNIEIGLLLNFGPQPQVKRKIFSNGNKKAIH